MELFDKLKAPFPRELVSWRIGATSSDKTKAIALGYIDARDVMERLDTVCGPSGWQAIHDYEGAKTSCKIGLFIPVPRHIGESPECQWVWKENGAGNSDVEAEKGAFSDSFKRAAVLWGIGRYLYDVPNIWVDIEPFGRSYKIKNPNDPKLSRALEMAERGIRFAEVEDTFKPENKSIQNALITKMGLCTDRVEMESFLDENKAAIDALPELISAQIYQEYENRMEAIDKGLTLYQTKSHRFAGVDDAWAWFLKMYPIIGTLKSVKVLDDWNANNAPFINGLECLKAAKYMKDGKAPKERFTDALKAKYDELSNIEQLNQPIAEAAE